MRYISTKTGNITADITTEEYIIKNLEIKGYIEYVEPIQPVPTPPTPYDLFNIKQALTELKSIFNVEIVSTLAGQSSMVIYFTTNKYFFDLNQYIELMIYQNVITEEFAGYIYNVFINQDIDLTNEPYRN